MRLSVVWLMRFMRLSFRCVENARVAFDTLVVCVLCLTFDAEEADLSNISFAAGLGNHEVTADHTRNWAQPTPDHEDDAATLLCIASFSALHV